MIAAALEETLTELRGAGENRRVTVFVQPPPLTMPSRMSYWAESMEDVKVVQGDSGLGPGTVVVTEHDGQIHLLPEGRIERITIERLED